MVTWVQNQLYRFHQKHGAALDRLHVPLYQGATRYKAVMLSTLSSLPEQLNSVLHLINAGRRMDSVENFLFANWKKLDLESQILVLKALDSSRNHDLANQLYTPPIRAPRGTSFLLLTMVRLATLEEAYRNKHSQKQFEKEKNRIENNLFNLKNDDRMAWTEHTPISKELVQLVTKNVRGKALFDLKEINDLINSMSDRHFSEFKASLRKALFKAYLDSNHPDSPVMADLLELSRTWPATDNLHELIAEYYMKRASVSIMTGKHALAPNFIQLAVDELSKCRHWDKDIALGFCIDLADTSLFGNNGRILISFLVDRLFKGDPDRMEEFLINVGMFALTIGDLETARTIVLAADHPENIIKDLLDEAVCRGHRPDEDRDGCPPCDLGMRNDREFFDDFIIGFDRVIVDKVLAFELIMNGNAEIERAFALRTENEAR